MSRLISVILLSILMFPVAGVVYLLSFFLFIESRRGRGDDESGILAAGLVTYLFIIGYWLALWRKSVTWTPERRGLTVAAVLGALILGTIAGTFVAGAGGRGADDFGMFIGTITVPLLWILATIFIWRESAAERSARLDRSGDAAIVCPTCGYNLTGLTTTRCPECGTEFTLDRLLANQPKREQVEIEA